MIRGSVNARSEAVVRIRFRGPEGAIREINAVVDSGYTGSLTLPPQVVSDLGLVRQSGGKAVLADGTVRDIDYFPAEIEWHDGWRPLLVSAVSGGPLLGMRMMSNHDLRIRVRPGGSVEIAPVP
jgi:clan AA aspartic protease